MRAATIGAGSSEKWKRLPFSGLKSASDILCEISPSMLMFCEKKHANKYRSIFHVFFSTNKPAAIRLFWGSSNNRQNKQARAPRLAGRSMVVLKWLAYTACSPGYNPSRMTGERLERMKVLAKKAETSFPPAFVNKPQEGPVATPEGDRALERGRRANANRKPAPRDSGSTGSVNGGYPTRRELDCELGGPRGFFTLCGLHYCHMFANPRMSVLFDTRKPDSAACAMDHGKRIAATLLDLWYGWVPFFGAGYFLSTGRGFSGAFAVMGTHADAKRCPMRPLSQQVSLPTGRGNRRFTTNQRDTWVGSLMCAAEECGTSPEFQEKFGLWLAMTVSAYAPFVDEETGQLDWMEESAYR
eukprot:7270083-Prymnesium_polylepis.1